MTRLLRILSMDYGIQLSHFDGGNLRNAIPREAFATIVADKSVSVGIKIQVEIFQQTIRDEFGDLEKDLKISLRKVKLSESVIDNKSLQKLINLLSCCPHGVIAWLKDMKDLVETSTTWLQ